MIEGVVGVFIAFFLLQTVGGVVALVFSSQIGVTRLAFISSPICFLLEDMGNQESGCVPNRWRLVELLMAAIPLVFFNLLAGLTSLSDIASLGRLGGKVVVYYFTTTIFALTLGLLSMHLLEPGVGMTLTEEVDESFGAVPSVIDLILDLDDVTLEI